MTLTRCDVIVVGPFPPPVHGMATTNVAVCENLGRIGGKVKAINTAAPNLERSVAARLARLPRVFKGLGRLATMPAANGATFYLSASGGFGQVYDALFVCVARLRRMKIYIRHCCFAYLDNPSLVASILMRAIGPGGSHITQSPGMAERLRSVYKVGRVIPISNAVLYPHADAMPRLKSRLTTLGFFSNLSAEKGIYDFLDVMVTAEKRGIPIKGKVAGAFQDAETERTVLLRMDTLSNVEYVGAVYGSDKDEFLSSIDVLVFPTRYRNETEAKVNHEAMSRGIPVIAYGRGCIPEVIGEKSGLVIDPAASFVEPAIKKIEAWLNDPQSFEGASRAAVMQFRLIYADSEKRWLALLQELAFGSGSSCSRMQKDGA